MDSNPFCSEKSWRFFCGQGYMDGSVSEGPTSPFLRRYKQSQDMAALCTQTRKLQLREISLKGFKSFRDQVTVGPLSRFSCVIGPNGCGKSVMGEAVAFVLGGNRQMMRAQTLSALINEETLKAGDGLALVGIKMEYEEGGQKGTVSLRRMLQARRSKSQILVNGAQKWKDVTQEELYAILHEYGIQAGVVDRYIVTQNRQAVNVQKPEVLLKYLETLVGSLSYHDRITKVENDIREAGKEVANLDSQILRIQEERKQIAPEVQKWEELVSATNRFEKKKCSLLQKQMVCLKDKTEMNIKQRKKTSEEESNTREQLLEVRRGLENLQSQIREQERAFKAKKNDLVDDEIQLEILEVEQSRMEAKIFDMEDVLRCQDSKAARLITKVRNLKAKEAQIGGDINNAEVNLSSLHVKENKVKKIISSLGAEMEGTGNQEASNLRTAANTLQTLRCQLSDAESAAAARESRIEKLRKKLEEMDKCKAEAEEYTRIRTEMLQQASKQNHSLCQEIEQVQEIIQKTQQEEDDLRVELVHAQAAREVAQKAAQSLAENYDALESLDSGCRDEVEVLARTIPANKLFGRVHNVSRVSFGADLDAVNAVLHEATNLKSCVIVDDRPTAQRVLNHFKENKVGIAICKIAQETVSKAFLFHPGIETLCKPLLECIEMHPKKNAAKSILEAMLGSWYLVEDSTTALKILSTPGNRGKPNLVTRGGELFKTDGEVVGKSTRTDSRYMVGNSFRNIGESSCEMSHEDVKQKMAAEKERGGLELRKCAQKAEKLQKKVDKLAILRKEHQRKLDKLLSRRHEMSLESGQPQPGDKRLSDETLWKREAAEKCLNQLLEERSRDNLMEGLKVQLLEKQEDYSKLREITDGGRDLIDAEQDLEGIQAAIKHAQHTREEFELHLERVVREIQRHERDIECTRGLREELKAATIQQESDLAEVRLLKDSCEQKRMEKDEISRVLESLRESKKKTGTEAEELSTWLEELLHSVRNLVKDGQEFKAQYENVKAALTSLGTPDDGRNGGCSDDTCHSTNVPDDPSGGNVLKLVDNSMPEEERVECLSRRLAQEAGALAREEARLERVRTSIDLAALDQDVAAVEALQNITDNVNDIHKHIESLSKEKESLEENRYQTFISAMKTVNSKLSEIYQFLTGNRGDARCSYTEDRNMLFVQGVTLHIRPDPHRWRPFRSLSGGQQSLATLALSFALQAAFPSPFYFFDEIDAALDTTNAHRVANYIESQSSAQYIVVSHKPQVFEEAEGLVGVYSACGTAAAVALEMHRG